jgi:chromosome segregation ATPase
MYGKYKTYFLTYIRINLQVRHKSFIEYFLALSLNNLQSMHMKSRTQEKIHQLLDKLEELKAVERHYKSTREELSGAEKALEALEKDLDKELKDIEALEGLSVKSLFHKVLGSKEDQLEKERQEYLQLSLKHKEHVKDLEVLEFELGILEQKMDDVAVIRDKIEKLKKEREKEILQGHSHLRNQLMAIYNEFDERRTRKAELTQAHRAGRAALASVKRVMDHLEKAKKWGDWDTMSRSRHYDRRKHSEIDRAIEQGYRAKHQLNIFRNELNDVGIRIGKLEINVESSGTFMDVLFDNLITDWVVQNKIKNALRNVEITHDKVLRLIQNLDSELNEENIAIDALDAEKDQLLVQ